MLSISFAASLITCFIIPPDTAYLDYVDFKTIACLFSILAVVGALRNIGAFEAGARALVSRFSTCRAAVCALVCATLVISMFATNDMALIMLLPLAAATLLRAGWAYAIPFTFVMQNLAANLGGMILPFGNPQNLYLFEWFHMQFSEFVRAMSVPFAVSVLLIGVCCVVGLRPRSGKTFAAVSGNVRQAATGVSREFHLTKRVLAYAGLLALTILAVFRIVPYGISTAVVFVALLMLDRKALHNLDFTLLATFVCFFVFAGNMARIPAVDVVLSQLMGQWPLLTSVLASQIISNVPAAVLLSHFTDACQVLLIGVNIGGAGTLVGSLASLITFQHYASLRKEVARCGNGGAGALRESAAVARLPEADARVSEGIESAGSAQLSSLGRFFALFSAYNFGFLLVLVVVSSFSGIWI